MHLPPPHFEISKLKQIMGDISVMQILVWMLELQVQLRRPHFSLLLCVDASEGPKVV